MQNYTIKSFLTITLVILFQVIRCFNAAFAVEFDSLSIPPSVVQPITTHPDVDIQPVVSPDGKWLAFASKRNGNFDIWIKPVPGGRPVMVTTHKADDTHPTWARNSKAIAFVSQREDAAGDIWQVKLATRGDLIWPKNKPEKLTNYLGFDGFPAYAPQSDAIAFVSDRDGQPDIYLYRFGTKTVQKITAFGATHPAWSPDKKWMTFTSFRGPGTKSEIYLLELGKMPPSLAESQKPYESYAGSIQVTADGLPKGFACWSPDSRQLVYLCWNVDTNGDGKLTPNDYPQLISLDISKLVETKDSNLIPGLEANAVVPTVTPAPIQLLTIGSYHEYMPTWSTDNIIYFASNRSKNLDIWAMPATGSIPIFASTEDQIGYAKQATTLPVHLDLVDIDPLLLFSATTMVSSADSVDLKTRCLAFQKVLDLHQPDRFQAANAYYQMGICQRMLRNDSLAQKHFKVVVINYPDVTNSVVFARMALLGIYYQGRLTVKPERDSLIAKLKKLADLHPGAHESAAFAFLAAGDLFKAINANYQAIQVYAELQNRFPTARYVAAQSQVRTAEASEKYRTVMETIHAYLAVLEKYPDQEKWCKIAEERALDLLVSSREYGSAGDTYREVKGLFPDNKRLNALAQFRLARLAKDQHFYQHAIQEYELLTVTFSDNKSIILAAWMELAEIYIDIGENLKAFTLFEKIYLEGKDILPDLSQKAMNRLIDALLLSARNLVSTGDYSLALVRYRRARDTAPDNVEVHRGYIDCMYRTRQIAQAVVEYESEPGPVPNPILKKYLIGLGYSYLATEKIDFGGNALSLNLKLMEKSNVFINDALSQNYRLLYGYQTLAFNYKAIQNYYQAKTEKQSPFVARFTKTVVAPVQSILRTITFYKGYEPQQYYEKAIDVLRTAIVLNDETENPELEAELSLNLAESYLMLGEFGAKKAWDYYQRKLKFDSTFVNKRMAAYVYENIGRCAFILDNFEGGPKYIKKAIYLFEELKDEIRVIYNKKRLAALYQSKGGSACNTAIDLFQEVEVWEKRNNRFEDLYITYQNIARCASDINIGDWKKAIQYAQKCEEMVLSGQVKKIEVEKERVKIGILGWQIPVPFLDINAILGGPARGSGELTTTQRLALLYTILGTSYDNQKNPDQAIYYLEKKLEIFRKSKDKSGEAGVLNHIGILYYVKGDFAKAWSYFSASLVICEKNDLYQGQLINSINFGRLVIELSETGTAEQTLEVENITNQKAKTEKTTLTFAEMKEFAAIKLDEILGLFDQHFLGQEYQKITLLLLLGDLNLLQNNLYTYEPLTRALFASITQLDNSYFSITLYQDALRLATTISNPLFIANACLRLGQTCATIGEQVDALRYLRAGRRVAIQAGLNELLWQFEGWLGYLAIGMDDKTRIELGLDKDAQAYYLDAIELMENQASGADSLIFDPSIRRRHRSLYLDAIEISLAQRDTSRALALTERMRNRMFLDGLSGEYLELKRDKHTNDYRLAKSDLREISDKRDKIYQENLTEMPDLRSIQNWKDRLNFSQQEFAKKIDQLEQENPELIMFIINNPIPVDRVMEVLKPESVILYYLVLPDKTLLWLINQRQVEFYILPIMQNDLNTAIYYLKNAIENGNSLQDLQVQNIQVLLSTLAPLRQLENKYKIISIIPDDCLFALPFDILFALMNPGQPLPELTYCTSYSSYYYAYEKRKILGNTAYCAAGPQLANKLLEIGYELQKSEQQQAIEQQRLLLQESDLICLNTFTHWSYAIPLSFTFTIKPVGHVPIPMTGRDIFKLNLTGNLVEFTTNLPAVILELPLTVTTIERAFLYAGVPSMLLAPQNEDSITIKFQSIFYQDLLEYPAARALAETKNKLMLENRPLREWVDWRLFGFRGMSQEEEKNFARDGFELMVRRGNYEATIGMWNSAITFYEQAYVMAATRDDWESMNNLIEFIIDNAVNANRFDRAIEYELKRLAHAEASNDVNMIARSYQYLAYFYNEKKAYDNAAQYQEKYLVLAQKYNLQEETANSKRTLGLIHERGNNYTRAIHFFHEALGAYEEINKIAGVAICLRDLGRIYYLHLENYPEALRYQREALELFEQLEHGPDYVDALQSIGLTYEKLSSYFKAIKIQQQALEIARENEMHAIELQSRYPKNRRQYSDNAFKSRYQQALSLYYLANVNWIMGNFQSAMQFKDQAMNNFVELHALTTAAIKNNEISSGVFLELNTLKMQALVYNTQGLVQWSLGQNQDAIQSLKQALDPVSNLKSLSDQAYVFKNIGNIYRTMGNFNEAKINYLEAIKIDSMLSSRRGLAYDFLNLGATFAQKNELEISRHYLNQALWFGQQVGDRQNEAQCYYELGNLMIKMNRLDSARVFTHRAVNLASRIYAQEIQWRAFRQMARVYATKGQADSATVYYHKAIDVIETMRASIKEEDYRLGFIDNKLQVYSDFISFLLRSGQKAEAFAIVERAKSRNFIEMLGNKAIQFGDTTKQHILEQGEEISNQLTEVKFAIAAFRTEPDSVQQQKINELKQLDERRIELENAYEEQLQALHNLDPELSGLKNVRSWNLKQIQNILPNNTALVEYYVGSEELDMWIVTNRSIDVAVVNLKHIKLDSLVWQFRSLIVEKAMINSCANDLYGILFGSIDMRLVDIANIVIVPHGVLHYLPFAALQKGEQYLLERFAIAIAPSATVLGYCLEKGKPFLPISRSDLSILALGNPDLNNPEMDLPFTELEIRAINREFLNMDKLLQEYATETAVKDNEKQFNIYQFSCHGVFDGVNPLESALLLTPDSLNDGRLQAKEIFGLRLDSYLVTMSACETGLSTIRGGDELIGLTRSFMYAGASSLMASLWQVDDLATAVLIKRFYRFLREGDSRAEALRKAQLFVKKEINALPAYWAAFYLSGDFR